MNKIDRLIRQAKVAATRRGHTPFRFTHYKGSDYLASTVCSKCLMYVGVNAKPMPNETEIGGEAVAVNCSKVTA